MVVFLDIETSNLHADIGSLIVAGFLIKKEEKFFFVENPKSERKVLEDIVEFLNEIKKEKIYIWNASFDIPFLISRCLKHSVNVKIFGQLQVFDLLKFSREFLRLSSNKLDDVSIFFNLNKNINITGKDIQKLYEEYLSGNKDSKENIINHCRDDLICLSKIYEISKDLIEVWEKKYRNSFF
jgi:uncharacterized protein YprB with RNaseH-like and TPR domain